MNVCKMRVSTMIVALSLFAPMLKAQDTPSLAVSKTNRTIAVTATERVTHMAEVGVVHLGFVQYGPTKDAAYSAGSTASNAIVNALVAAGVKKEAIQSETQELTENQIFNNGSNNEPTPEERRAKAFAVRQSWTVRAAADEAAKLLDTAVKAGANQSGQIDWELSEPNAAQAEAAGKAIQRAQTQAKAMAAGLGVHLGDLLYASNQVEGTPVRKIPRVINMMQSAAAPAPAPLAINAREIETAATVYAVFALE